MRKFNRQSNRVAKDWWKNSLSILFSSDKCTRILASSSFRPHLRQTRTQLQKQHGATCATLLIHSTSANLHAHFGGGLKLSLERRTPLDILAMRWFCEAQRPLADASCVRRRQSETRSRPSTSRAPALALNQSWPTLPPVNNMQQHDNKQPWVQ
jgi:hypothetical protein